MNRRTVACAAALLWMLCSSAQAQNPSINTITPGAVAPGKSTDVTITGANLAGATALWTSFPAKVELAPGVDKNGTLADRVVYRITLAADAQVGIGAIRVATGKGASSLKLMMVDDLESVARSGKNTTRAAAQAITLPAAIDGHCDALKSDYYKFTAKAGTQLTVDVLAGRIGSALDPALYLTDKTGRVLVFSDDALGVASDSRLAYKFAADGEYTLTLRDIRHQGGGAHRYRMRLGNFPLTTVAYPMGTKAGTSAAISAAGPATEGVVAVNRPMPQESAGSVLPLSVRFPNGQGSGFVTVLVGDSPEAVEAEPNDEPKSGTKVSVPGAINGRFEKQGDRDYFLFNAKKGQRLVFRGRTRSLGSPTDLLMRLSIAGGSRLAEAEDAGTGEGAINHTIPSDGVYLLEVEDLLRRGGPEYAYRIEVEPYRPGFTLSVDTDLVVAPKDGTFALKVTCGRRDYNDAIELSVVGAGEGLSLAGNVIAKGKKDTQLQVTLPPRITSGQLMSIKIVGKAKIGKDEFVATASTLPALRKLMPQTPYPPAALDGLIGLGVGPVFPEFFAISVDSGKAYFPQLVGAGSFKVKLKRLDGKFKAPIAMAVENLPAGFSATVKPIDKPKNEYLVSLKGPDKLAEGLHKIRLVGTGTHASQTKKVVLPEVPLQVVRPLLVEVIPAGTIAPGGKQKVRIRATRFGGEKTPIEITFKKRPAGVTSAQKLTIAPDKQEIETELTAATDAKVGKTTELIVSAATKVKGQDITVESPAATLEIKK